jgi:hypothetical protein
LDGKEKLPTALQMLARTTDSFEEMRRGMLDYSSKLSDLGISKDEASSRRTLITGAASGLSASALGLSKPTVSLVVTSPPYLGVHVLYHRWQMQGRKEVRAPFFIASCDELESASSYTMVSRHTRKTEKYFTTIAASFSAVRRVLRDNALVIQLVSFADATDHLPQYLDAMQSAGLELCESYLRSAGELTWRTVPGRRWYARVRATRDSSAAQEVLLVHRKVG